MTTSILNRPTQVFAYDEDLKALVRRVLSKSTTGAKSRRFRLAKNWEDLGRDPAATLILIACLRDTDEMADRLRRIPSRDKRYLLFMDDMPCQTVPERIANLRVQSSKKYHLTSYDKREGLIQRLSAALTINGEDCILDAWWERDTLVLLGPMFKRLSVSFDQLTALKALPEDQRGHFEIHADGAYIHWPSVDVHMGWDQFAQVACPEQGLRARQRSTTFNKEYGASIRKLRKSRDLPQAGIAGLTERQVRRIELGECRATHSALVKLAEAHSFTTDDYLRKLANLMR